MVSGSCLTFAPAAVSRENINAQHGQTAIHRSDRLTVRRTGGRTDAALCSVLLHDNTSGRANERVGRQFLSVPRMPRWAYVPSRRRTVQHARRVSSELGACGGRCKKDQRNGKGLAQLEKGLAQLEKGLAQLGKEFSATGCGIAKH